MTDEPLKDIYTRHGGIPVFGIMISHSWREIGAVLYTVWKYKVNAVLEIGVHHGGLGTLFVSQSFFDPSFRYMGFEIKAEEMWPAFINALLRSDCDVIIDDALEPHSLEKSQRFLSESSVPLVYCDGGNKPREFVEYGKLLPLGGLLMVHDYTKEINDEDFVGSHLRRLDEDYLEGCRQALFINDHN